MSGPAKRPVWHDAYDTQMALWRWYRTPLGTAWLRENYAANTEGLNDSTRALMRDIYDGEAGRLLDCDPIYVSRDMCEIIEAAAATFQPEALLESDLITPRGFLYFATPFDIPDRYEQPVTIAAASWTRMYWADDEEAAGRAREHMKEGDLYGYGNSDVLALNGFEVSGVALTLYSTTDEEKMKGLRFVGMFPPVVPMHLTPWYLGMSFSGNEWDEIGTPTGAEYWWRIVQTTFRLMQQKIVRRGIERPDRAGRREAKRLGAPDTEIVVVRLRHEQGPETEPTGADANYSHRFIVGGHWRDQPYPSEGIHRQIWISPYVKGPEDKPLIVRPRRVFQWTR